VDRLTSIPVIAAGMGVQLFNLCYKSDHFLTSICCFGPVIDFDNTDTSWRKYDASKEDSFSVVLKIQNCKVLWSRALVICVACLAA
jgi:hypothetical protein